MISLRHSLRIASPLYVIRGCCLRASSMSYRCQLAFVQARFDAYLVLAFDIPFERHNEGCAVARMWNRESLLRI